MSSTFPLRTFHSTGLIPATVDGELVLESSLSYQVAVNGKVIVLQKTEWRMDLGGSRGGFEDIFSMFGGR